MFNAYFMDTITIKLMDRTKWGEPQVGSTVSVKGRINYSRRTVFNDKGQRAVSSAVVMINDRVIGLKDRIVFDDVEHTILNITRDKDFSVNKVLMISVA